MKLGAKWQGYEIATTALALARASFLWAHAHSKPSTTATSTSTTTATTNSTTASATAAAAAADVTAHSNTAATENTTTASTANVTVSASPSASGLVRTGSTAATSAGEEQLNSEGLRIGMLTFEQAAAARAVLLLRVTKLAGNSNVNAPGGLFGATSGGAASESAGVSGAMKLLHQTAARSLAELDELEEELLKVSLNQQCRHHFGVTV